MRDFLQKHYILLTPKHNGSLHITQKGKLSSFSHHASLNDVLKETAFV